LFQNQGIGHATLHYIYQGNQMVEILLSIFILQSYLGLEPALPLYK
jgi:hypothetical protein